MNYCLALWSRRSPVWMRRLPVLGLFTVISAASVASAADEPKSLFVKVRETRVRTEPSHLASSISALKYGDPVTSLSSTPTDGWFRVRAKKGEGYIHVSAVTPKKVVLSDATAPTAADRSEMVMAGKGFSLEVEKAYAEEHANLNFTAVNRMERVNITDPELKKFVKEGQLVLIGASSNNAK